MSIGNENERYVVVYIEEREEDHDWEINWSTDDKEAALKNARELAEGVNIDAVKVLDCQAIFEYYDENAHQRPWSKEEEK